MALRQFVIALPPIACRWAGGRHHCPVQPEEVEARACHASLLAAGFAGLERVVDWWLGPAVRRWARPRLRPLAELRKRQSAVGTIALDSAGGHEKPGVRDTVDLQ